MCIHCRSEDYLLADVLFGGFGGRRGRRSMGLFGDPFGFDDGINRNSFAPVSQRAMGELERVSAESVLLLSVSQRYSSGQADLSQSPCLSRCEQWFDF